MNTDHWESEYRSLENKDQRLAALQTYQVLDTLEEQDFDDLTALAAAICGVPIALISLVDEKRQWFKSHFGLSASETPLEQSFCAHAIAGTEDIMIVEDANKDNRFKDNPLVTGKPSITFYAGVPLVNEDGFKLGTLCVIDPEPKILSAQQKLALRIIARQVMDKLELRRKVKELEIKNEALLLSEAKIQQLNADLVNNDLHIRALIQQAPVATIVFKGDDLIIEAVNQSMLKLLGKGNEILNMPLLEAVPELRGQPAYELLYNVYTTGSVYHGYDTPVILSQNGALETRYYNFTYSPLIEDGSITGIIDIAVDVTEQVLGRKRIEEAGQRARLSTEAGELGAFEINFTTSEIVSSPRFDAIFDIRDTRDPARYISALHKDDLAAREVAYKTAFKSGALEYEARVLWKDGSTRWVRIKGALSFDENAMPLKMFGVVQDITKEKMFAEELQKQVNQRTGELQKAQVLLEQGNKYQQQIINKFDGALASLAPIYKDGKIADFYFKMTNTAYKAYSGLTPEAIQDRRVSDVFPGYFKTDAFNKYVQTFETGKTNEWELHYNLDGLDVYLQITASKMDDEVVVSFIDVTAFKALQLNLLQKLKELERSNEELQQFAHVASHDLKEPVRKIKIYGGLLVTDFTEELPELARLYLKKIESATDRIYDMIDGVLLYSSLNAEVETQEKVDLNNLIQQIEEDLEIVINKKQAIINSKNLPVLEGSFQLFYQLFYNLISNALKFTKKDTPPVVEIKHEITRPFPDSLQQYTVIKIIDNGIGFEQKYVDTIFKTFIRLNSKDKYEGTGLGLALCQKIAERFGGSINAEGREGKGAVFTVLLPLKQVFK